MGYARTGRSVAATIGANVRQGVACPWALEGPKKETTRDGGTRAYDLFAELAPTHVMAVPTKTAAGRQLWRSEISGSPFLDRLA